MTSRIIQLFAGRAHDPYAAIVGLAVLCMLARLAAVVALVAAVWLIGMGAMR